MNILQYFLYKTSPYYHHVNIEYVNETTRRDTEYSKTHWPVERYEHVIRMKQQALNYGREIWADYIFVSSAHFANILSNATVLSHLPNTCNGIPELPH